MRTSGVTPFRAEIVAPESVAACLAGAAREGVCTSFQTPGWLSDWYACFAPPGGPVTPLVIDVTEATGGERAFVLPLVLDRSRWPTRIRFADGGVTDYCVPILGPAAPVDALSAASAFAAVRAVLPRASLLTFEKLPAAVYGRPNPLALVAGVRSSPHVASVLPLPEPWEDYLKALPRHTRKEFGRTWRVFQRFEGAAFLRITDPVEAMQALARLETIQRERIAELDLPYALDDPQIAAFYRRHLAGGLSRGDVVLTALKARDDYVAILYGTFVNGTYSLLRIASLAGPYASASPGRTLAERTMHLMKQEGATVIDFALGDYVYKRRFGAGVVPLMALEMPLGVGGVPHVLAARARHHLRTRHPGAVAALRRLAGRSPRPAAAAEGEE